MRAFVCEVDQQGLRRLLPAEELGRLARRPRLRPPVVVWALLEDRDAEELRAEVGAGRHRGAFGVLMDRAVELLPIDAAVPEVAAWHRAPQ